MSTCSKLSDERNLELEREIRTNFCVLRIWKPKYCIYFDVGVSGEQTTEREGRKKRHVSKECQVTHKVAQEELQIN